MDPDSLALMSHLSDKKDDERSDNGVNRKSHLREVGEMRLVASVIQLPSGLGTPGTIHPFAQMSWYWAEVGPGEGSP